MQGNSCLKGFKDYRKPHPSKAALDTALLEGEGWMQ